MILVMCWTLIGSAQQVDSVRQRMDSLQYALQDEEGELYVQSPAYVYELMKGESLL